MAHHASLLSTRAVVVLALIYVFYVVPLTYASSLVDPDILASLMPGLVKLSKEIGINLIETISGLLSSLIWSCFFMLCPQMFKVSWLQRCPKEFVSFTYTSLTMSFSGLPTMDPGLLPWHKLNCGHLSSFGGSWSLPPFQVPCWPRALSARFKMVLTFARSFARC